MSGALRSFETFEEERRSRLFERCAVSRLFDQRGLCRRLPTIPPRLGHSFEMPARHVVGTAHHACEWHVEQAQAIEEAAPRASTNGAVEVEGNIAFAVVVEG